MQMVDVVVVGAGPVGLLAAVELALGGVGVLVLERLATANMASKALGVGPLGFEALQRRGMAAALEEAEARSLTAMKIFMESNGNSNNADMSARRAAFSGHVAGLMIRKAPQKEPERRIRPADQHAVEAMLADRAKALGIEVRRECEVSAIIEQSDGVIVEWMSPTGADSRSPSGQIRCAFLLGCDGGRSSIRKMAGFAFPGTPPTMTMYTSICAIDHPERLLPAGWRYTPRGVFFYGPFPNRLGMLDFSGPPQDREAPVTREEIETVLRRISGEDVRVKALESASRWTDNTRLVDSYRKGRVLLAGDAAHIHSPFGGQGLSLGLVDAANLGWKLAAVLRGEMPESLLDTYTDERRPVAEAVLANTLAQAALMRPDPQSGALRSIVADLMQFDDVSRFFGEMVSGLSGRYDFGSERNEVGRLIADRPLRDGLSLYELMQDGSGVFLDASSGETMSKLVSHTTQNIRCVAIDKGPSMLIRPDACVAWTGEGNDREGLEDALRRWFNPVPVRA